MIKGSPWRWWVGSGLSLLLAVVVAYVMLSALPPWAFPGGVARNIAGEGSQVSFTMDANVNYWVFQRVADEGQAGNNCSVGPNDLAIGMTYWSGGRPDSLLERLFYQPSRSVSYDGGTYFYGNTMAQSETGPAVVSCPRGPILIESASLSWSRVVAAAVVLFLWLVAMLVVKVARFRSRKKPPMTWAG